MAARSALAREEIATLKTIGEVAETLDLPQHVLRFWETRFKEIDPVKRAGGRRFYRPRDIELVEAIRRLLYREGYTIKGVQRVLRTPRSAVKDEPVAEAPKPETPRTPIEVSLPGIPKAGATKADLLLREILSELKTLRALLD